MKDIAIAHGNTKVGINREWAMKFKSEAEFLKAMEGKITDIAEPRRTEILKDEFSKLQPKEEAPTAQPAQVEAKPVKKG